MPATETIDAVLRDATRQLTRETSSFLRLLLDEPPSAELSSDQARLPVRKRDSDDDSDTHANVSQ